jgi:16S rRNA (cytosine967-C5)-methyltransferase
MREAQRLAAEAVARVLDGRSLTETLESLFAAGDPALSPQQRGATQDLAYGALRFLGTLRAVLGQLLERAPADPRVYGLLLVSLYQLEYRRSPQHAVVSEAVSVAGALKAPKALVNAVLRRFLRDREALLAKARESEEGRYSHPQWWVERVKRDYPDRYQQILEAANERPPMTLRVNRRRSTPEACLGLLESRDMVAERVGEWALRLARPVPVQKLPGFAEGLVSVQDLGAQHAAALLDARDGMRVLDACAAPGGKTAHILESANVECLALDSDAARLFRVRENLDRLGLEAAVVAGDAGAPGDWWDGRPFDRILADVPCSASGVARRHPDIKWLRREADIARYAAEQERILDALWRTLAPGGKLLYATCSVFSEENRFQIASFLQRHLGGQLLPVSEAAAPDGQLLPDSRNDGFFYALLGKRSA